MIDLEVSIIINIIETISKELNMQIKPEIIEITNENAEIKCWFKPNTSIKILIFKHKVMVLSHYITTTTILFADPELIKTMKDLIQSHPIIHRDTIKLWI